MLYAAFCLFAGEFEVCSPVRSLRCLVAPIYQLQPCDRKDRCALSNRAMIERPSDPTQDRIEHRHVICIGALLSWIAHNLPKRKHGAASPAQPISRPLFARCTKRLTLIHPNPALGVRFCSRPCRPRLGATCGCTRHPSHASPSHNISLARIPASAMPKTPMTLLPFGKFENPCHLKRPRSGQCA